MTLNELTSAQDQMMLLGRKTASEKIASFLLMLCDRTGREDAQEVAVPMTRTGIADYLGLTTETVSRTFTQLRKSDCIKLLDIGTVHLSDRNQLEELAVGTDRIYRRVSGLDADLHQCLGASSLHDEAPVVALTSAG